MKRILLALTATVVYLSSAAQCSLKQIPLNLRANASDLIIEGKVVSKNSFWNTAHNMIYTSNTVEVYKVFKGSISTTSVEILTTGGTVGYDRIIAEPSLSLNVGDAGVFTCETVKRYSVPQANRTAFPQYEAYGSVQGFVKYDLANGTASDPFQTYTDIETQVYATVLSPSMPTWIAVAPFDIHANAAANRINGPQNSIQSVSGFSPTTITAGTGSTITITGTGFGSTQGSGTVGFKNADDGGATYINPLASQYISWSNTQIVVEVPAGAGTGTIQVTQGVTQTSSQTLTISYAHLNVEFDPGPGTIAYQTDHVNDNGSGGYTWRMNTGFAADASASAAFLRAFDNWRCTSGVNWTIGANTSINDAVSDGTNIICYDNTAPLSDGILGVCYSYWSGCASGQNIVWYVNELDIIFDEGSNISPLTWEYGTATPSINEYDFESVAVHELGHGHQLGHVINSGAIMHYALSNGSFNRTLSSNDIAAANFVQAKSVVANICGPGAMTKYVCATTPVAAFSGSPTSVCAGATVSFTDQSTNTPTSWSWTFTGGTPSSSSSQNPTVTYSTPGTYAVSLTATNSAGSDVETINAYITVSANPSASISFLANVSCNGGSDGAATVSASSGTPSYVYSWAPSGGSSATASSLSAGTYTCTVTDAAGCTTTAMTTITQPTTLSANISSHSNVSCNGGSDGSAMVSVNGGTAAYMYSWSPSGGTGATASSLSAGTYTCTVTDANGCTTTALVTITQPSVLSVTAGSGSSICNGDNGSLSASATGGTGAVSYVWIPGNLSGANVSVSPSSTTTYTVTGTDSNGCTDTDTETITVNTCSTTPAEALSFDGSNDVINGTTSSLPQGIANRSFTAWIKPSSVSGTQTIFYYGGSSSNQSSAMQINGGNLYYSGNGNDMSGTSVCAISPNVWTHVAVTVSNKTVKFYVNGALKFTGTLTSSPATSGTSWTISSSTTPFSGWMDELSVWSTAITAGQVATSMNTELAAQTGLIGLYHFNQGNAASTNTSVTSLTDASSSSSTGTLSGFALTGSSSNWVAPGRAGKTKLKDSFCGTTLTSMSTQLIAETVSNATNYQWEFTDMSNSQVYTYIRGNNSTNFSFNSVPQLTYNKTYSVQVKAYVNGSWGTYGESCSITTPSGSSSTTQLQTAYCGITVTSLSSQIFCDALTNTTNYEYEFTDLSNSNVYTYIRGNSTNYMTLNSITQLTYARTYSVRVRGYFGGSWGSFGNACQITTPAFPTTQMQNTYCNTTLTTMSSQFYCDAVSGAGNYEWEFTDMGTSTVYTKLRGNALTNFNMTLVPGIQGNTTYSVRVRAIVGGVAGTYGSSCLITTANTSRLASGDGAADITEQEVAAEKNGGITAQPVTFNVYPNPNNGLFNFEISSAENMVFELYDALGRTVIKEKVTSTVRSYDISGRESGMYYIRITQNNQLLYSTRLVKQD
jgi:PKD repeat protein